jgi:signal transduction histidine kinase
MSPLEMLRRQPQWLALIEALAVVALIGWFDHATGWEWSFFAPYALPIVFVVWKTDWRWGMVFALLCAATSWAARIQGNPYHTGWTFALAVFGWWFYFSILVVAVAAAKSRQELDRAKIEMLRRTRILEQEVLLTSEQEQQRIGRDLHDGLGPHLVAIGYAATFLENELSRHSQTEAGKAGEIREMATAAASLAQDLARGLFSVPMDGPGLSIALQELARSSGRLSGISVSFLEPNDILVSNPEHGMHFYRIAQEAVNNAIKHSGAGNVTIVLSGIDGGLRLTIADDGKGMPPVVADNPGVGLNSMRLRARSLGGELVIESKPGEGTVISCDFPNPCLPPVSTAS